MSSMEFINFVSFSFGIILVLIIFQTIISKTRHRISNEQNQWNKIYKQEEKAEEFEAIYIKSKKDQPTEQDLNREHKKFLRIKNSSLVQSLRVQNETKDNDSRMVNQEN